MAQVDTVQERRRLTSGETSQQEVQEKSWIELHFRKRECIKFLPNTSSSTESLSRCRCGRLYSDHFFLNSLPQRTEEDFLPLGACAQTFPGKLSFVSEKTSEPEPTFAEGITASIKPKHDDKWNIMQHTGLFPTDAYGTLEFQGTGEGDKSKYIRLAHDTSTDLVLKLFFDEWGLNAPKMVITVHGGAHNFQLQSKLHRVFCNGLIKAAKTTGAWIMTFGLNTGVGQIVGDALKEHKMRSRGKIVSVGVAPWGVVDHREDLIGSEQLSAYQTMENPISKGTVLHTAYTHFLLVDNGTEGRYDSELRFRRQLERRLSLQQQHPRHGRTSVVCLVLEGGKNTINVVLESVRQTPPIPVIVCDGSGRAADLLAFAHQYVDDDGSMMEELKVQLLVLIQDTFKCNRDQAQYFYLSIMECVKKKDLITIFRMGKGCSQDDIDIAILTATLKAQSNSATDMLNLALSWNRIDIAKSQIFVYGRQWPVFALEQAMMDALQSDRVEFVKLLMENGVSMHKFLTVARLEELYNAKPPVNLVYLINDVRKNFPPGYRFSLLDIGQVIELLMGGAYRSNYTRKRFRVYYASKVRSESSIKKQISIKIGLNHFGNTSVLSKTESTQATPLPNKREIDPSTQFGLPHFPYPFHELMIWAVLMKRQKMALFMCQQGEEAIAKALVATKLYKTMAKEAADDDLDIEESDQLRTYSKEFQDLALQLVEICYHADDDATKHLLTYELKHWSRQTCLSLAVTAKHREFIAHRSVQLLINDLWMGGLNERKNSVLKVIMGVLVPPAILTLDFKTLSELQLMPQTMEEHMHEVSSLSSSVAGSSSSSSSESSSSSSSSDKSSTTLEKPEVLGRPLEKDQDAYTIFMTRPKQLTLNKKIYEFYNAPITKFWMYATAYAVFLVLFTYVCLVRMESYPSVFEWIVVSHVITYGIEKVREIVVSEPSGAIQKVKVWAGQFWNCVDAITITIFLIGFGFRIVQEPYFSRIGRTLYCVDIVLWYIHILNVFSVNKNLGPYIMLMGKMMVDMLTFIVLLAVVLCSFGVARQSILHPNRNASWAILKDVLLEPYFMLYGEVYAGTIDPCDGDDATLCVTGSWLVPILMTIYLLVANILLINLLIAVFNNTFARGKKYSDRIWKFQRYLTVVEYELRPVFPPPLILVSYVVMFILRVCKGRKSATSDRGLKLFLDDDDVEKLHDFEEECVDEYMRRKDEDEQKKSDNRVQESLEKLRDALEEMHSRDSLLTNHFYDMHERLTGIEEVQVKLQEMHHSKLLARSRHNTGGLSDPWSIQEGEPHFHSYMDRPSLIPSRTLMSLKHRKRTRQDSELSTASDWHQPHYRVRTISQDRTKLTPVQDKQTEDNFPIRRTNSTGVIPEQKHFLEVSEGIHIHPNSQLSIDQQDSKSLSCQDIMMVGTNKCDPISESDIGEKSGRCTPITDKDDAYYRRRLSRQLDTPSDSDGSARGDSSPGMFLGVSDGSPKFDECEKPIFSFEPGLSLESTSNIRASTSTLPRSTQPLQPEIETTMPRNKSFNDRLSLGRKFLFTTTPVPLNSTTPSSKPTYKSITDSIDTSRWHEMYAPKVPQTPLDSWWIGRNEALGLRPTSHSALSPFYDSLSIFLFNEENYIYFEWGPGWAPDFDGYRPVKFSDQNSLMEWDEDGDASRKKKGRSKHRKRMKRNKKLLSELPGLHLNSNNNIPENFSSETSTFPRSRRNMVQLFKLGKSKSQTLNDGASNPQ